MVSKITNKILPTIEKLPNRPLEKIYPMIFLDAIHYPVRENEVVVKNSIYSPSCYYCLYSHDLPLVVKNSIYSPRIQFRRLQRDIRYMGRRK
ncbi:MAG: transposase [Peptoniphilaceae bacterium]